MKTAILSALAGSLIAVTALSGGALAQSGPIKIGVVTPLSGTYTPIGQQVRWGLELAAKEINAAGGVAGRQIALVFEDEEANPAVAVQKAEKLFQVEKVDFLTGTVNSGSTLAVAQLAERNNKLAATTVSFADSITGDKCSPNMFRVNARAEQQSVALAAWLAKEKPKAKVYYLGPDYEMGRSTVAAFKSSAEKTGSATGGEVFAPLDSKDYTQYFGQIRATRPQVLYTSVAGNDTVRLLTQLQDFGLLSGLTVVGASGTVTSQNITPRSARRLRASPLASAIRLRSTAPRTKSSSKPFARPTRPIPISTAPTAMAFSSPIRRPSRRSARPIPTKSARRCAG